MAGNRNIRVEIEGLRELRAGIRDLPKDVRKAIFMDANRPLAEELLQRSLPLVPVKTGRLKGQVQTAVGAAFAGVQVRGLKYANFIHWGAVGWPKARGAEAKAGNRRLRKQRQRQTARYEATKDRKIPGTLFIWRPAKRMAKGQDSEVKRLFERSVNGVLNNLEHEINRARSTGE